MRSTNRSTATKEIVLGVILALGIFVAGTACQSNDKPSSTDDSGDLAPRPTSVADLVQRAKLIVIGTVSDVLRETSEGPVGQVPKPDPTAPSLPQFTFTYYSVTVDTVIAGSESLEPGQKFTLRVNGSQKEKTQSGGEMMMPQPGEQRLFVLESDPLIPDAYFPHPWGIFDVAGSLARFDDVEHTSVQTLTNASSPSAFADALRTALGSRR